MMNHPIGRYVFTQNKRKHIHALASKVMAGKPVIDTLVGGCVLVSLVEQGWTDGIEVNAAEFLDGAGELPEIEHIDLPSTQVLGARRFDL